MWKINSDLSQVFVRRFLKMSRIGLVMSLSACSQNPSPIHFYMLEPIETEAISVEMSQALSIALSPLQLPRYLNRTSIISRAQPRVYDIDPYQRWAENLSDMLNRIVPYNLQQLTKAVIIKTRSSSVKRKADLHLKIQIFQFHINESQEAVLTATWGIQTSKGKRINSTQTYIQAILTDRTEDRIQALNETVNQMSRDIAAHLLRQQTQPIE